MSKNKTIVSSALAHMKKFLNEEKVTIVDLEVVGRYLKATLNSGCLFSVLNKSYE